MVEKNETFAFLLSKAKNELFSITKKRNVDIASRYMQEVKAFNSSVWSDLRFLYDTEGTPIFHTLQFFCSKIGGNKQG
jgi:hypothetical protein